MLLEAQEEAQMAMAIEASLLSLPTATPVAPHSGATTADGASASSASASSASASSVLGGSSMVRWAASALEVSPMYSVHAASGPFHV